MAALRYTRQVRLADVGPSGQERLAGLRARVAGDGLSARVEALYLAGAGARVETDSEAIAGAVRALNPEVDVLPEGADAAAGTDTFIGEMDAGPAEVAQGAMRALLKMRGALEGH